MKILIPALLLVASTLLGQNVEKKFYSNGQLSLERKATHFNADSSDWLFRSVKVYSYSGALVWNGSERKVAGHATVRLKFHNNGGVKQIDYSSHPDGGIQWEKETLKLDSLGRVIFRQRFSNENLLTPTPYIQEEVKCSTPYATKYFIENSRWRRIKVTESNQKLKRKEKIEFETIYYSNAFKYLEDNFELFINGKHQRISNFETDTITNGNIQEITFYYR